MIVRGTRQHTQIEIDVKLRRGEYSVNTLITNVFFNIYGIVTCMPSSLKAHIEDADPSLFSKTILYCIFVWMMIKVN